MLHNHLIQRTTTSKRLQRNNNAKKILSSSWFHWKHCCPLEQTPPVSIASLVFSTRQKRVLQNTRDWGLALQRIRWMTRRAICCMSPETRSWYSQCCRKICASWWIIFWRESTTSVFHGLGLLHAAAADTMSAWRSAPPLEESMRQVESHLGESQSTDKFHELGLEIVAAYCLDDNL